MATAFRVVLVSVPRGGKAAALAAGLVSRRLAACVSILPGAVSLYRWEGRVRRGAESLLVIKTAAAKLAALERWISARHPHEVPEFVALSVRSGSKKYLSWLAEQVR